MSTFSCWERYAETQYFLFPILIFIHILLYQQSDCNKSLNKEKQVNSQLLLETKELTNEISKIKVNVEEKEKTNLILQKQIEEHKEKIAHLEAVKNEMKEKFDDVVKQKEIQELDIISTSENLRLNCLKVEELNGNLNDTLEKLSNAESQINAKTEDIEKMLKAFEAEKALLLTQIEQQSVESKSHSEAQNAQLQEIMDNLEQKDKEFNEVKLQLSSAESQISLKALEIQNNLKAFEAEKSVLLRSALTLLAITIWVVQAAISWAATMSSKFLPDSLSIALFAASTR